jgi:hypothetical protein
MSDYILPLDPSKRSTDTVDFQKSLRSKIVGQEEGVQALVDLYQVFRAPPRKNIEGAQSSTHPGQNPGVECKSKSRADWMLNGKASRGESLV